MKTASPDTIPLAQPSAEFLLICIYLIEEILIFLGIHILNIQLVVLLHKKKYYSAHVKEKKLKVTKKKTKFSKNVAMQTSKLEIEKY